MRSLVSHNTWVYNVIFFLSFFNFPLQVHREWGARASQLILMRAGYTPGVTSSSQSFNILIKGTSAVLWGCTGTSKIISTLSIFCPQIWFELRIFHFLAHTDRATTPPGKKSNTQINKKYIYLPTPWVLTAITAVMIIMLLWKLQMQLLYSCTAV